MRDLVDIFLHHTELLALFRGQHPVVEVGGVFVGERFGELGKLVLQFGRPLQLQRQVWHGKAVVHETAVVSGHASFGAGVAAERDELAFVDLLRDEHARILAGQRSVEQQAQNSKRRRGYHD